MLSTFSILLLTWSFSAVVLAQPLGENDFNGRIESLPIHFNDPESFKPITNANYPQEMLLFFSNSGSSEDLKKLHDAVPKTVDSAIMSPFVAAIGGKRVDAAALSFPKMLDIKVSKFMRPIRDLADIDSIFESSMNELFQDNPPSNNDAFFIFYNLGETPNSKEYLSLEAAMNKFFRNRNMFPAAVIGGSATSFAGMGEPGQKWIGGIRISGSHVRFETFLDASTYDGRASLFYWSLGEFAKKVQRGSRGTILLGLLSDGMAVYAANAVQKSFPDLPMTRIYNPDIRGSRICGGRYRAGIGAEIVTASEINSCYVAVSYGE